jgi:hypothetical protein
VTGPSAGTQGIRIPIYRASDLADNGWDADPYTVVTGEETPYDPPQHVTWEDINSGRVLPTDVPESDEVDEIHEGDVVSFPDGDLIEAGPRFTRAKGKQMTEASSRANNRNPLSPYDPEHWRRIAAARSEGERQARSKAGTSIFEPVSLLAVDDPPPLILGAEEIFPESAVVLLIGEANVGKTPLDAYCALERVRAWWDEGYRWAVYDQEMGPARWKRLLQELGATDEEIQRLPYYSNMGNPADLLRDGRVLFEKAWENRCRGITFDSLISMIAVSGIKENDAEGIRAWVNEAARPWAVAGGSAHIIDHSGLASDDRPRGSTDKKPAVDFAAVMKAEIVGARGISGRYTLTCVKDRDARLIGSGLSVAHKAAPDGSFTYEPDLWNTGSVGKVTVRKAASSQSKILNFMAENGRRVTAHEVAEEFSMEYEAARSALNRGANGRNPVFVKVGSRYEPYRSGDRSG